jgi:hypothetical protein
MTGQSTRASVRRELSGGTRPNGNTVGRMAPGTEAHAPLAAHPHRDPCRRKARAAKVHIARTHAHAVPPRASHRGRHRQRAVLRLLEVAGVRYIGLDERRLEQARIQLTHHLGGADRCEVRRPLVPPLRTERVAEREQHERAGEQPGDDRQHHQRRLPALLAGEHPGGTVEGNHSPPRCRGAGDRSTHARNEAATTCRGPWCCQASRAKWPSLPQVAQCAWQRRPDRLLLPSRRSRAYRPQPEG